MSVTCRERETHEHPVSQCALLEKVVFAFIQRLQCPSEKNRLWQSGAHVRRCTRQPQPVRNDASHRSHIVSRSNLNTASQTIEPFYARVSSDLVGTIPAISLMDILSHTASYTATENRGIGSDPVIRHRLCGPHTYLPATGFAVALIYILKIICSPRELYYW